MPIENREYENLIEVSNIQQEVKHAIFYDYDNTVLLDFIYYPPISIEEIMNNAPNPTTYYYAETPEIGEAGTAKYADYDFIGQWNIDGNINDNLNFHPIYQHTYVSYIIQYKNWDGTLLQQGIWVLGDNWPNYTQPAPTRPDDTYRYVFSGWDDGVFTHERNNRIGVYTAQFSAAYIYYWNRHVCVNTYKWNTFTAPYMYVWDRYLIQYYIHTSDYSSTISGVQTIFVQSNGSPQPYGIGTSYYDESSVGNFRVHGQWNGVGLPCSTDCYWIGVLDSESRFIAKNGNQASILCGHEGKYLLKINANSWTCTQHYYATSAGAYVDQVNSSSANTYPINGEIDGYFYKRLNNGNTMPVKGTSRDSPVYSTNISYPENGVYSDGIWYEIDYSATTYSPGNLIDTPTSTDPNAYPINGRHSDGYYYYRHIQ